MIQVKIKTNTLRDKIVTAEVTDTVISVFQNLGVDVSGAMTNLDGSILSNTDLHNSFAQNGVVDGATVRLNSVVKADGTVA
jgi:hypothetical protein